MMCCMVQHSPPRESKSESDRLILVREACQPGEIQAGHSARLSRKHVSDRLYASEDAGVGAFITVASIPMGMVLLVATFTAVSRSLAINGPPGH
jgi:hypothetical protein